MKKNSLKLSVIFFLFIGLTEIYAQTGNTFTDSRDGNKYKIVTIGKQVWMAENLKYLPSIVGPNECSVTTPFYYVLGYFGTDTKAAKASGDYIMYGVLYNWQAAKVACPLGWHLPSDAEWIQLTTYLGGALFAGDQLKEIGTTWGDSNTGATNKSGFTALPGGYLDFMDKFKLFGINGYYWSSTKFNNDYSSIWYMKHNDSEVINSHGNKKNGYSVRCIKD